MTFQMSAQLRDSKAELYTRLAAQLRSLLAGERDFIANAANFASLLFHSLPDLNWAGFYLCKDGELVLGPFQGKPACVRIAIGKGVCGTAADAKRFSSTTSTISRPHRLRQRFEFRDRGSVSQAGESWSACSTSTVRCLPGLMTLTQGIRS